MLRRPDTNSAIFKLHDHDTLVHSHPFGLEIDGDDSARDDLAQSLFDAAVKSIGKGSSAEQDANHRRHSVQKGRSVDRVVAKTHGN
jgi:hypothetical protein